MQPVLEGGAVGEAEVGRSLLVEPQLNEQLKLLTPLVKVDETILWGGRHSGLARATCCFEVAIILAPLPEGITHQDAYEGNDP